MTEHKNAQGRPISQNPKNTRAFLRLNKEERQKLEFTAAALNMRISDVLRRGIELMYEQAKEKE